MKLAENHADARRKRVAKLTDDVLKRLEECTAQIDPLDYDAVASLSRATAALTAEARQQDKQEHRAFERMSADEKLEAIKELITELPRARITQLVDWLAEQ